MSKGSISKKEKSDALKKGIRNNEKKEEEEEDDDDAITKSW
jgi:hypothetical protein